MSEAYNPNAQLFRRKIAPALLIGELVLGSYISDISASVIANPPTSNSITTTEHTAGAGLNVKKQKTSDTLTFVISGLGVQSGEGIARSLDPSLGQDSDVSYLTYSTNELNVDDIKNRIYDVYKQSNYKHLRVFCHSMGGTVFTNIEKELLGMGVNIPVVILDGSPDGADAVRGLGRIVTKVESVIPIGGYFTEFGVQLFEWTVGSEKRPQNSLSYQVGDAWRLTNDENSPRTWASMLDYLQNNNIDRLDEISGVPTYYLVPPNVRDDDVVNIPRAIKGYERVIENFEVVIVKSRRHASPTIYSYEYNQAILKILNNTKKTPDNQVSLGSSRNLLK